MNRRNFIRGAAGLLVAAGAGDLLLPERRPIFALDRTMMGGTDALYAEWRDLTAHVNAFDIRYTAQVTPPRHNGIVVMVEPGTMLNDSIVRQWEFEFVINGRRYPVVGPADVRRIVQFERTLTPGDVQ